MLFNDTNSLIGQEMARNCLSASINELVLKDSPPSFKIFRTNKAVLTNIKTAVRMCK